VVRNRSQRRDTVLHHAGDDFRKLRDGRKARTERRAANSPEPSAVSKWGEEILSNH
jgi:hypothetical protein